MIKLNTLRSLSLTIPTFIILLTCPFLVNQSHADNSHNAQLTLSQARNTDAIQLVSDPWPPYIEGTLDTLANQGIVHDTMVEIMQKLGKKHVIFPLLPWQRAMYETKIGMADGIPTMYKSKQREKGYIFTNPIFQVNLLAWYQRSMFPEGLEWKSMNGLKNLRIGVIKGYSYGQWLDTIIASKQFKIVETNSIPHAFKMLKNNRVDIAIAAQLPGSLHLSKVGWGDIDASTKPVNINHIRIGLSKKGKLKDDKEKIDNIILQMTQDGSLQRIFDRYQKSATHKLIAPPAWRNQKTSGSQSLTDQKYCCTMN